MNNFEKEHVTPFFYKNSNKFKIINFRNKKVLSNLKISVDCKKDLIQVKKLINKNK